MPEVQKSVDFYSPITDPAKTLEHLNLLSQKEPTDQELFEGIANTFATIARMDLEQEVVFKSGFKALDWPKTDEV